MTDQAPPLSDEDKKAAVLNWIRATDYGFSARNQILEVPYAAVHELLTSLERCREALTGCLSMLEGMDPEESVAPQQMRKARAALSLTKKE